MKIKRKDLKRFRKYIDEHEDWYKNVSTTEIVKELICNSCPSSYGMEEPEEINCERDKCELCWTIAIGKKYNRRNK